MKENAQKNEGFSQVCVWPATLVGEERAEEFEKYMMNKFETRIQYLEEIETFPDTNLGENIEGTGGRNDVFFAVHNDDIGKFAVPRLEYGIRWIEDVLSKDNYKDKIYPTRVFEYKTW
jgi:hypothetical protein